MPAHDDLPEGISPEAAQSWPSRSLIDSWLGDFDFELRPGEDVAVPADDGEAIAAARRFRDVLGRFCSGVTVVTTMSGGAPVGMTCQSFSSVSLTPPLVMFVPARTARVWPAIQRTGSFAVNLLAAGQEDLSNRMATRGIDKFAGIDWRPSLVTGSPVLEGALGYIDCRIEAVHEAGDHFIVVGRVHELSAGQSTQPLLFFEGSYRGLRE